VRGLEEPLPLLNPRSVGRVIDDIHHEDLKDALCALNTRLVELDDRVPDDNENARESFTGAWRVHNRLARVVDPTMAWPVDEDDVTGDSHGVDTPLPRRCQRTLGKFTPVEFET